jgi:exonuclease VII small subunit
MNPIRDESNFPKLAQSKIIELMESVSALEEMVESLESALNAKNRDIERLESLKRELLTACLAVEFWWLREGMQESSYGAPGCLFLVREVIAKMRDGDKEDRDDRT